MRAIVGLIIWLVFTNTALAGPWLREEGHQFISLSAGVLFQDGVWSHAEQRAFVEYGLGHSLTVGAKYNFRTDDVTEIESFARVPVLRSNGGMQLSVALGIGRARDTSSTYTQTRAGISWGRGFSVGERPGWMSVDASYVINHQGRPDRTKIDGTVGITISPRSRVMGQVFLEHSQREWDATVSPGLILRAGPDASRRWVIQYEHNTDGKQGVRVSMWQDLVKR